MVAKGGLTNPSELIDNRVGGLVNVTRPDAIAAAAAGIAEPVRVPDLLEALGPGLRRLTLASAGCHKGLNKDAISKQNSAAMVEQLATMTQQRQKIIARHFANRFLKHLCSSRSIAWSSRTSRQAKIIDVAGTFVPIDPSSWKEKRDVIVELTLGYGEAGPRGAEDARTTPAVQLRTRPSQPMYALPNRHALC